MVKRSSRLMVCALLALSLGTGGCFSLLRLAIALLPIKLLFMCIPEGTPVDTPGGPVAIETIQPGDWVVGYDGDPVRVLQVQAYAEDPRNDRFLKVEFEDGSVVRLCDMHRLAGIRAMHLTSGEELGGKTVKSISNFDGVERSYDLITEDAGYRIGGVPVNSMVEEMYEAGQTGLRSLEGKIAPRAPPETSN